MTELSIQCMSIYIGDLVLVKKEPYKKHEKLYDGPYRVVEEDDKNVALEISNKKVYIHKNRIAKHFN